MMADRLTSREVCNRNGFCEGDIIAGSQGEVRTFLKITAIGDRHVLAREVGDDDVLDRRECVWNLNFRNWIK